MTCSHAWIAIVLAGCSASHATPASSPRATKLERDDAIADVGAPCAIEGDMACASDGSSLLACTKRVMVETSRCRGAKACAVLANVPTCDRTIAEPGDRCDAESEVACTKNHEAVVQCRDHVMVQTTVCHCRAAENEVRCE